MTHIDISIVLVLMFCIGYLAGHLHRNYIQRNKDKDEISIDELNASKEDFIPALPYHIKPKYLGYNGGYSRVTICAVCGRTALYEDQHPAKPCPECGGTIVEWDYDDAPHVRLTFKGKWVDNEWILSADSPSPCNVSAAYRNSPYCGHRNVDADDIGETVVMSSNLLLSKEKDIRLVDVDSKIT